MSHVTSFSVKIHTNNITDAGTDGSVYIGLGGREFTADTSNSNDFEKGADHTYKFGDGSNVSSDTINDPRSPSIRGEDVAQFPVYIRFEPSGSSPAWNLREVTLQAGPATYRGDYGAKGIWLQQGAGKMVYLKKTN